MLVKQILKARPVDYFVTQSTMKLASGPEECKVASHTISPSCEL